MSFSVKKVVHFPQGGLDYVPHSDNGTADYNSFQLQGGIFRDNRYAWQSKGPVLEVRNTKTGLKVGGWIFGGVLKDSNTRIICVEEISRPNGRISLLAVGIHCTISGGIICIFDVFSSKVLRAIQIKDKISSLHVIDPGIEDLNLPGPLRNFDGILAAGTDGGEVLLIDICRQICEESLHSLFKKDELNPSQLFLLTSKNIPKIEHYKERSVRDGNHLAIHLNAVFDRATEHFVLKGPKGDDRVHVNKEEVTTSALYYCSQLTSLLVGYNFGAFQLWNLTTLTLVYTSPVCEEHLPITNFALQEPTDDPRAFCYIWVAYSNIDQHQIGLPFAVMYSLCYESKEYHEGYGYLYQDFHYCAVRFQIELGKLDEHRGGDLPKGGCCLGFQPITKSPINKESFSQLPVGDTLALCLVSWVIWYSNKEMQTCCILFDLNQWYKEQMPNFTKWTDCSNYILTATVNDLIYLNGLKTAKISGVLLETKSLSQFMGVQRLEEHFYPTSLSFNLWILRECDLILMSNKGLQKSLLSQIESVGPLCLVRPSDVCKQALNVGLIPLFIDVHTNNLSTELQREFILNVALEHQLISWLCKCASEWANGSFSSAGCSLEFILTWAFQRALVLRTNCDQYCTSLFDYSRIRLDSNNGILLNNCTRQINGLCILYKHIVNKLPGFVGCLDVVTEQCTALEMVSTYFEVLQWLVNVGLLPECHPSDYPRPDFADRISAPYPIQELKEFYNEKRAELRLLCKETFDNNDNLLFIDNLIDRKCGGSRLQKLWQEDDGNGLYPPPSLQSLIRTYLVEGASISHKHSLVIYLLLDLAMALDQSRYSSVVTHLIKFPAVFKVSSSIIKITQAFWQLDHGDFTTAMEQLLDPFVLGDDLQSWHHTLVMRSLLIHKQPNFALLYMQIRKPPITDEKDVLTAISLFIANNMLDEAFYFKKQHQNNDDTKLLSHLFHECSNNDALHLVLYKCLSNDEEKAFFQYLKTVKNPSAEDLQIFYYLLRSRFVEAFDVHNSIRKQVPDRQGLIGQSMATKTDQIVKIFKTLLPDVNRNLVDYVRKERSNIWREVERPTPMSVFVHDTNEQVKYKSTLIHAALSKAKQTVNDSMNENRRKDLITEETPFLRTPTVCKNTKRIHTPVITPKVIDLNESVDEVSGPPSKKIRLTPRAATKSPSSPLRVTCQSLTHTPIVKRKNSSLHNQSLTFANVGTPQSILKVRQLVQQRDSITDETFQDDDDDNPMRNISMRSSGLRLQPRSSLSRITKRPHVQFHEATRFSTSVSDQSSKLLNESSLEDIAQRKSSSKDVSRLSASSADEQTDDVFYSPDNSGAEEKLPEQTDKEVKEIIEEKQPEAVKEKQVEVEVKDVPTGDGDKCVNRTPVGSPRARRSYKRSFGEMSPTRSSPRLSKLSTQNQPATEESEISEKASTSASNSFSTDSLSPKPTRIVPKIKGRKSLTRQVLENNAFSQMRERSAKETLVSTELSFSQSEKIVTTEKSFGEVKVTTEESNLKITDKLENSTEDIAEVKKTHTSSSFVAKEQFLEKTLDTDTSLEVSYQYEDQENSGMKLSDSLQEYIDFLMASGKKTRENEQKNELSKVQLDFAREEEKDKEEAVDYEEVPSDAESEVDKDVEVQEVSSEIKEIPEDEEVVEDVHLIEESDEDEKHVKETPMEVVNDENLTELTPVQIQEPTNIVEDVDESSKPKFSLDIEENVAEEVYNDQELSFNELEANIFGVTDDDIDLSKTKRSSVFTGNSSENYSLLEREIAFLEDSSDEQTPVTKTESIVLISSSDEENSKDSHNSRHSAYSKTTEEYIEPRETSSDESNSPDYSDNSNNAEEYVEENIQIKFQYEEQLAKDDSDEDNRSEKNAEESEKELSEDEIGLELTKEVVIDKIEDTNPVIKEYTVHQSPEDIVSPKDTVTIKSNKDEDKSKVSTDDVNSIEEKELVQQKEEIEVSEVDKDVLEPKELVEKNQDVGISNLEEDNKVSKSEKPLDTDKCEAKEIPMSVDEESNKKDHSTNTTVEIKEKPTKQTKKIDSSTNTTILVKNKSKPAIQEDEAYHSANITDDNKELSETSQYSSKMFEDEEQVKRPITRRYSLSRQTKEELSVSSTDTTEGESFRKETVVAQVHTPSRRTRKKSDAQSIDVDVKSTRQFSNLVVSVEKNDDMFVNKISRGKKPVLGKRTRRALSTSDVTASTKNINIDCDLTASPKIIEDAAMVKLTLSNKKTANLDTVKTFSRSRTNKRHKSVDELINYAEGDRKINIDLPAISEEEGKKKIVDSYATARRLTRRQANLIKDVTISTETESSDDFITKQIDVEPIDPINLLDKEAFEGKPDPEENLVYEQSSPSTSNTPSLRRRKSRSNSVVSDNSVSPVQNQVSTPRKSGRFTRSQTRSPVASGVSTRSRKMSEASSVASDQSETTPVKKFRKKQSEESVESVARSTRSRTGSVSSVKSDGSVSKKGTRGRRLVSAKSDLPEIVEEKSKESVDSASTSRKKR